MSAEAPMNNDIHALPQHPRLIHWAALSVGNAMLEAHRRYLTSLTSFLLFCFLLLGSCDILDNWCYTRFDN
jgi:hypothetical protein